MKDKKEFEQDRAGICQREADPACEYFKAIRDTLKHFNIPDAAYSIGIPRENAVFMSYDGKYNVSFIEHGHEQGRKSFGTAHDAGTEVFGMLAGKFKVFRMKKYYRSLCR